MNTLKPSALHTTLPNIQLVVNNTSVKAESLASFHLASNAVKPQAQHHSVSWSTALLVVLLHVLIGMKLMQNQQVDQPANTSLPMMVTLVQEKQIEIAPTPEIKPIQPKPVVQAKPKIVATTQDKTKLLASEELAQIKEPTPPTLQVPEVTETIAPAKVAVAEAPVKTEPKPEPVYVAPSVGANYLHNPAPDYPQMARRKGEQGRVLIKVLVTSQGDASNVTLERSSGSTYLDDAAIKAVKNWKFVPARSNNEAVSGYVTVPINFSLES